MILTNLEDVKTAVVIANKAPMVCLDCETASLDMFDIEVLGFGFATSTHEWYVDFGEVAMRENKDWEEVQVLLWRELAKLLDVPVLLAHNAPFDMWVIDEQLEKFTDIRLDPHKHTFWDTMALLHLFDENLSNVPVVIPQPDGSEVTEFALSLKAACYYFLGRVMRVYEENQDAWSWDEQMAYGLADVRNCFDLADLLLTTLSEDDPELLAYYQEFVAPMCWVTLAMERNGIRVDIPKILEVQEELQQKIQEAEEVVVEVMPKKELLRFDVTRYEGGRKQLSLDLEPFMDKLDPEFQEKHRTAKGAVSTAVKSLEALYEVWNDEADFPMHQIAYFELEAPNPGSTQDLAEYLLAKGYRLPLTDKGNPSVREEVLDDLERQHPEDPIWKPMAVYRQLKKLLGTYVSPCADLVWDDGRVHPQWNQTGTVTGRYSATGSQKKSLKRGPALQTIPTPDTLERDGWLYNPREWFIAEPGKVLVVADLKQAEVRWAAVMSQDPNLIEALVGGGDIHSAIAEKIFPQWGRVDEATRKSLRNRAKTLTFGIGYGMGPNSASEQTGLSLDEAKDLIDDYYEVFNNIWLLKQQVETEINLEGRVRTFLGRYRTPILTQAPPKVTATPNTKGYERQLRFERLWRACYDKELQKARFDETASERETRGRAYRQAYNFMIQGSVAEQVNWVLKELVFAGYKVLGQIHDEVIIEIDPEQVEEVAALLEELVCVEIVGVPFEIDIHVGSSWAAGKE